MCSTNKVRWRRFAGAGLAAGVVMAAASGAAVADNKTLKMAFFASPKHQVSTDVMQPMADAITKANVGLTVKYFPGSQIGGSPPGAFKRVINGIADIEFGLQGYTSTVFPRTLLLEIPVQHKSPTEATKALWKIYDKHLKREYKGTIVLAMWFTDVPVIMTNKLVRKPDDLKGLKLRTPSRNQAEIIRALGAVPVAMPMPQTYGAIEKGVVDGAIVGVSVAGSFKLAEVVKNYIVDLPFGYSPQMVVMNARTYNSLTPAQKKVIDENRGLKWSLIAAKSYEEEREKSIKLIKGRKDTQVVKLTDAERAAWVAKLKQVHADWIKRFAKQNPSYKTILTEYLSQ